MGLWTRIQKDSLGQPRAGLCRACRGEDAGTCEGWPSSRAAGGLLRTGGLPLVRPAALSRHGLRGDLHAVPSDGTDKSRWETAGHHVGFRAASSGTGLLSIPDALCSGRCQAPLSASSRQGYWGRGPAAPARRRRPAATPCTYGATASSVQAKRVLTTPGYPRPARPQRFSR